MKGHELLTGRTLNEDVNAYHGRGNRFKDNILSIMVEHVEYHKDEHSSDVYRGTLH